MIVPMKKAAIIVQQKDASSAVRDLRRLGVLHVEHQNAPLGKDISALQEDVVLVDRALEIFSNVCHSDPAVAGEEFKTEILPLHFVQGQDDEIDVFRAKANHVISLWKHYDQLQA